MSEARELRDYEQASVYEARELRDYEQRGVACKRRVNCATTNAFTEVYDILNVRGAMNCATTNKEARRVRGAMNCATTNKEARELRDYERVYGGVNERGVFFFR